MLEIILIVTLSRRLASKAEAKGRSKMWGALLGANWIVGEVLGFVLGAALGLDLAAYGLALAGAGVGALIAFAIVGGLDSEEGPQQAFDGPVIGHFDADNPYSPPGTYPKSPQP